MRTALRAAPALLLALAACTSSSSPTPVLSAQPGDVVVQVDVPATFAVTASGATAYQWRRGGAEIPGATEASYTTPGATVADDHSTYSVVVSGQGGSVTSGDATLRVVQPPVIEAPPADTAALEGGSATFSVAASGNGELSYQWRRGVADLAGATEPVLTVAGASQGDVGVYTCSVTNAIDGVRTVRSTRPAFLAVIDLPVITLQPVGALIVPGDPWTLRAAATTARSTHTYQWQKDGMDLPGATGPVHGIPAASVDDAGSYTCVVSNTANGVAATATSAPAVVTVQRSPLILAQPGARGVVVGQPATFRVAAKGEGTLTYRWHRNGTPIAGPAAAEASYTTPAAALGDNGASFHVVISNGQPPDAVSASAPLAVLAASARLSAGPATATSATAVATALSAGEGLQLSWVVPAGSTATLRRGGGAPATVTTGEALEFPLVDTSYVLAVTRAGATTSYQVDVAVKQYNPRYLFVANSGSDDLSSYSVDLLGAPLFTSTGPTTPAGHTPIHLVASPDERRLYAANAGDGTVSAFDVDPASGALAEVAGSPFALSSPAAAPWASAIDPSGARLYVACAEGIEVFAIDLGTGALSALPGQAVSIPGRLRGDLLVHPTGRALYVADAGHALVKGYAIAADGSLTFTGEAPAGLSVGGLALERGGRVLFARGGSPVAEFNGQLDAIAVAPDGTLGAATTFAGFGPQAAAHVDLPFVRGTAGRHGVATSRRPGVDSVFDGYDGERRASTSYSAYVYDRDTAAITGEWVDGVVGWSSPLFVDSFDLVQNGDSVVVDRSGALIVLPIPGDWNRLYAWTQNEQGAIWVVNDGFMMQTSKDTGTSPAHACFTGTLQ